VPPPEATGAARAAAEPVDVCVVGGGVIGGAAALAAARAGYQVLLLDRAAPLAAPGRLGVELRTLAVSPASAALLDELGVWSTQPRACYHRMVVWEELGTGAMTFDAADVGRAELGWIVENGPLAMALWDALDNHPRVRLAAPCELVAVQAQEQAVALSLRPGLDGATAEQWHCRLLVGADGARSRVRELLAVDASRRPTGHHALATVIRSERPHDGVAWQRFLRGGPVALLPTREPDLSAVVWSQPDEQARARQALPEAAFRADLGRALQHCLGAVDAVDERAVFPLDELLVSRFRGGPRSLLIGDAARVIHPLAGQGANIGFEDVRELLAVLRAVAAEPAPDPGAPRHWRAFDRRRRTRSQLMLGLMRALRAGYGGANPALALARNLAVGWLDGAAPVKQQIIREALGLGPLAREL